MTINECDVLKYLQKKWDFVRQCGDRGMDTSVVLVDKYMACEAMAEWITGKKVDIDGNNKVYFVEE